MMTKLLSLLVLALVISTWELVVNSYSIRPQILPAPSLIGKTLWQYRIPILGHTGITLARTSIAFAIGVTVGIVLALIFASSSVVNAMSQPLLTGFYCLPKSVVVPIFLLWTGIGTPPAILTGVSLAFFPVLSNVLAGLNSIPRELYELCRVHGGSRGRVLLKVGIPSTLPFLFAAFRSAGPGALIGVIVAEMMAASNGLGYVIVLSGSVFNVPLLFSAIFILGFIGIIIYVGSTSLDRRFARWAFR